MNLSNNKIIGIHGAAANDYNLGSFLSDAINEFINKYKKKDIIKNIDSKIFEIEDKSFFIKLYNKGLIKDIQIENSQFSSQYKQYKFLIS